MNMYNKLREKSDPKLEDRFKEIRQDLVRKGRDQSQQYKINITDEAEKIGASCRVLQEGHLEKKHNPSYFVDVALGLLCYPPELGFIIANQLSNYANRVGFNPFGTIMVAISQIDSLYRDVFVRNNVLDEKPELSELINDKAVRVRKAGELLAVGIIVSSNNVKSAKEIYHTNTFDHSVKVALDEQLGKYDRDLAKEIIR